MLLVYRPPDQLREQAPPVEGLPHFSEIVLVEFSVEETSRLVELKLARFFGEGTKVPDPLLERVTAQAAGNPFYIEETLNYLQDLGIDLHDTAALQAVDLPTSIYALVLSRIDQLSASQQLTIKIASVIGRLFRAAMVWGAYPDLPVDRVQQNLDVLARLDLTLLDTPDPELTYLFKHVITQQVAYESLLYATRAMLHEQIGLHIERTYPDSLEQYTNILAFHFEHSEDESRKREYLLKAGEAAQEAYALGAAITYFEKSLPLLEGRALIDTRLKLGNVFELTGAWDNAGTHYDTSLSEAQDLADWEAVAWCQTYLGELYRKRNQYETAENWLAQALETFKELDSKEGIGQVLHYSGTLADTQGDKVLANQHYIESLAVRRELGDRENEASLLSNLGIVARSLGNPDAARRYYEESLAIREEIEDRWGIAVSLNNLGNMVIDNGDYATARDLLERALLIWREIGERWATTNTLHNLANVAREEGDVQQAQQLYAESIAGWEELDDRWGMSYWLEDTALLHLRQASVNRALQLISAASTLREQIGAPRPPVYQARLDETLAPALAGLDGADQAAAVAAGQALPLEQAIAMALDIAGH
jgi:tetratricopeptide (TPR) repeat protein